MEMICVQNLQKKYRIAKKQEGIFGSLKHLVLPVYEEKEAVKGISFVIEKGESVAFLGANGAGKSTTVKMLTGILKPSGGTIEVMGRNPFTDRMAHAAKIGVVFGQKTQLWWDLPVIETFRLLKGIYEIPDERYEKNLDMFCDILCLREFLNQPARKLSLGQRVRADLAACLLHEPPLLFLDEPTIGLDVAVKQNIYSFLKKINTEQKTTLLLTSHDLNDLESLCGRLIVLEHGEVLFDGGMEQIFTLFEKGMTLEQIVIRLFQKEWRR
ncbi:MAG: ATP-binding cassette domain-containing protein [Eubacterium sp.]|nr:ATP-binding cassette domain-containing protein [Eubacterium sp.]